VTSFDPFEIVASALTARAFLEPLGPPLRADMTFDQANDLLVSAWDASGFAYEPVDRVSLVYRQTQLAGWYSMDMYDSDLDIIGEVVHPIHPDEIASADTPALKLVHILAERPRSGIIVFVLEEDAIIGTVSPEMFWGPVFRLCLFALTLELEGAALAAAMRHPLASWNALSPGRRAKAEEIRKRLCSAEHRNRPLMHERAPLGPLLATTSFADKGTIVAKTKLLEGWTRDGVKSLFGRAERVRNSCAHTRDTVDAPLGRDAKGVAAFVDLCTRAIAGLRTTQRDGTEAG
jgi:hypothetical protein